MYIQLENISLDNQGNPKHKNKPTFSTMKTTKSKLKNLKAGFTNKKMYLLLLPHNNIWFIRKRYPNLCKIYCLPKTYNITSLVY